MDEEMELIQYLQVKERYAFLREVPDHGLCGIRHLLYSTAIFCDLSYDGYGERYCFEHAHEAVRALAQWDGGELTGYKARR